MAWRNPHLSLLGFCSCSLAIAAFGSACALAQPPRGQSITSNSVNGVQTEALALAASTEALHPNTQLEAPPMAIASAPDNGATWLSPDILSTNFPSFNSARLDAQIRLYGAYLTLYGPPDVLIVGSSRSLQGIDPVVLENALATRGYQDLQIYNFSVNGATARVIDIVLRQILSPDQLPDLVIWGDGSRAFNNGRPDATYDQIISSPGYAALQTGQYPITYRPTRFPKRHTCPEPLFYDYQLPQSSSTQPLSEVGAAAAPAAAPAQPSAPLLEDFSMSCDRLSALAERPRRWERDRHILHQRWVNEVGNGLTSRGFLPVTQQFDPATYYTQYPKVPGAYDTNYVPFQLEGEQAIATVNLVRHLHRYGVPLVFVNLPLSQDYLDAYRNQREQLYRQFMEQKATQENFLFLDLNQPGFSPNAHFADPSHLNQYGAEAIATHLARSDALPWSRLIASSAIEAR